MNTNPHSSSAKETEQKSTNENHDRRTLPPHGKTRLRLVAAQIYDPKLIGKVTRDRDTNPTAHLLSHRRPSNRRVFEKHVQLKHRRGAVEERMELKNLVGRKNHRIMAG